MISSVSANGGHVIASNETDAEVITEASTMNSESGAVPASEADGAWSKAVKPGQDVRSKMMTAEVRLLHPDDANYKWWLRKNHFAFNPPRARCPYAQDYHRSLLKWEEVVRSILRLHIDECPKRILCCKETKKQGRVIVRYRELDYVHGYERSPKLFVEIKHRETTLSGSCGLSQMVPALDVARLEWPSVAGLCLNVHMAAVLKRTDLNRPPLISLEELPIMISPESHPGDAIPILWIDSKDVAIYAIQAGLLTEKEVEELPRQRELAKNPFLAINRRVGYESGSHLGDIWPANFEHVV